MCMCVYVCTYVCVFAYMHVCVCLCVHACMCACVYKCKLINTDQPLNTPVEKGVLWLDVALSVEPLTVVADIPSSACSQQLPTGEHFLLQWCGSHLQSSPWCDGGQPAG